MSKIDMEIKPSDVKKLAIFDIQTEKLEDRYVFSFPVNAGGLKLLAEISVANTGPAKVGRPKPYQLFSRGVFNPAEPWTVEVFGNAISDRRPFDRLINFLEENGFRRIDNKEYDNNVSMDYTKGYGKPDDELKSAFAERTHSGIEVIYQEVRKNPLLITLRIPYFKELLVNADKMNEQVRRFLVATGKKCDGCRYCVQTDKTGKRPLASVSVGDRKLCPYFPGFSFCWRTQDNGIIDDMIGMLEFIDELFADRRC
ncbi:MAG: hypothetical protein JW712_02375 [Dehalococcoidales bacterium]|nr:hypothetical protein [Dehalococcoidales bacterium]